MDGPVFGPEQGLLGSYVCRQVFAMDGAKTMHELIMTCSVAVAAL